MHANFTRSIFCRMKIIRCLYMPSFLGAQHGLDIMVQVRLIYNKARVGSESPSPGQIQCVENGRWPKLGRLDCARSPAYIRASIRNTGTYRLSMYIRKRRPAWSDCVAVSAERSFYNPNPKSANSSENNFPKSSHAHAHKIMHTQRLR